MDLSNPSRETSGPMYLQLVTVSLPSVLENSSFQSIRLPPHIRFWLITGTSLIGPEDTYGMYLQLPLRQKFVVQHTSVAEDYSLLFESIYAPDEQPSTGMSVFNAV